MTDDRIDVVDEVSGALAEIRAELAGMRRQFDLVLKRQMLPLDEGMLAIRHEIGWIVVPQEEFATIAHLADGFSGHEIGSLAVMRRFVRPGDTVLDIGAHIGLHTIPLAQAVGRQGRVIAIEPIARSAEALRRALICNALADRGTIEVAAAGDQNGTSSFYLGSNSMLGSLFPVIDNQKLIEVPEIRLDDYLGADAKVDFVKMDVEGAEIKALAGMLGLIANNPTIGLIAEYGPTHLERVGIEPTDWFAAFADAGLGAAFLIDEADGSVSPVDHEGIAHTFSANILFVKDAQQLAAVGLDPDARASR